VDYLRRLHGFEVSFAEPDATGRVSGDALAAVLRADTTMVSVHYANNEIGTVQPISELVARAHEVGARFHTDAVQAAGWLSLDLRALGVDALSIAGHKLGAPKGCGVLAIRAGVPVEPLIHGGGQERGRRSGTENVAGAVAMATALRLADAERLAAAAAQVQARDEFTATVLSSTPDARLTGDPHHRLPAHASFVFPGTGGEAVLLELERRGIIVSSGSACAAGSDEPSHVLTALGYTDDLAGTAVRFSWSAATPPATLISVAAQVAEAVRSVAGIGTGAAAGTR
jgi:cysteine desulfurase